MEVERAMSSELQALKQELQQKGNHNRPQDEEVIGAMREQVYDHAQTYQTQPKLIIFCVFSKCVTGSSFSIVNKHKRDSRNRASKILAVDYATTHLKKKKEEPNIIFTVNGMYITNLL